MRAAVSVWRQTAVAINNYFEMPRCLKLCTKKQTKKQNRVKACFDRHHLCF